MDRLRDEFTIGMNHLDLLGLDWDPDWWMLADANFIMEDNWDFDDLFAKKSMFMVRKALKRPLVDRFPDLIYMDICEHIGGEYNPTEWHLPTLCTWGGGMMWAIQLALTLRHNPIYLLGCDLYTYRSPDEGDINHFHLDYSGYRTFPDGREKNGPEVWDNLNKANIGAFELAKQEAEKMGVTIYNATVGGKLEVFERVDIWDLLSGR